MTTKLLVESKKSLLPKKILFVSFKTEIWLASNVIKYLTIFAHQKVAYVLITGSWNKTVRIDSVWRMAEAELPDC